MSEIINVKIIPYRKIFYNQENNFGIYACKFVSGDKKLNDNITIKGNTLELELYKEYNAALTEKYHERYGTQYEIISIVQEIPKNPEKQKAYLKTILTEKQVENIFKVYPNEDVISLIRENKFDYSKIHGIGEVTYKHIRNKIIENTEFQEAFLFLAEYNISNELIIKLVKHFKSSKKLIEKLKKNPYYITEVNGIGFKTADKIAMKLGHDPKNKMRIKAAIEYAVEEISNEGHTFVKITDLAKSVYNLIDVDSDLIIQQIKNTNKIIVIEDKIALKKHYDAERNISKRLLHLLKHSQPLNFDVDSFIEEQENKLNIKLTKQQKEFFNKIKKYNVNILAGSAGTGKSSLVNLLIQLLEKLNISYKLVSPTAKAAKVLKEYTDRDAETIHRAIGLGLEYEEFQDRHIYEEFLIVDETSMVDVQLCSKLLDKCIHKNLRVLFVGDPAQLVAVSAGNILHDMIDSNIIPITVLDTVFRQEEGGALDIITRIRKGQKFLNDDDIGIFKYGDNCIIASVPQEKVEKAYKYYFNEYLKDFDHEKITIATPTNKGKLGTVEINKHIQNIVNKPDSTKKEKEYGKDKIIFREGDLVINTKNSYNIKDINEKRIDVVNGDTGKIIKIDEKNKQVIIDFEFAIVPFGFNQLNQLLHCWAMTTHRLQGSSNSVIIVVADKSNKYQLNANLLYTACSRTTDKLVLISQAETINYAMKKKANLQRNTFLKDMLKGEI